MNKISYFVSVLLLMIAVTLGLASCGDTEQTETCEHRWTEATCSAPKTCSLCNKTEGDTIGHTPDVMVKHEGVAATHNRNGILEYYTCNYCNIIIDNEGQTLASLTETVVLPTGHIRAIKIDAREATCSENGNIDYYFCESCDKNFEGKAPEARELTDEEVTIPALGHTAASKVDAVPAGCTEDGAVEHYFCTVCEKKLDGVSAEAKELSAEELKVPAAGHSVERREPKEATHTESGNIECWYCEDCGNYFDGEGEDAQLISAEGIVVPAKGHVGAVKVEATRETHTVNGNIEYYHCEACGKNYDGTSANAEWIPNGQEVFFAMGHGRDIEPFYEVAPTCTEAGHITYYYCKTCDKKYNNGKSPYAKELTDEEIIIPPRHSTEMVEYAEPTCAENGWVEHYKCTGCDKLFADAEAAEEYTLEDITISATGVHTTEFVETTMSTHTEDGIFEHYKCTQCNKLFADAEATEEYAFEDIIILSFGHEGAIKVHAKEPTETEDGNIQYYNCPECGKNYNGVGPDAEQIPFGDEIIPAKGNGE